MSLAELLPAIRALPKPEQVQLLHLLIDGMAETPATPSADDGITEEMRKLLPPHDVVVPFVWPTTVTFDGGAALVFDQLLAELGSI